MRKSYAAWAMALPLSLALATIPAFAPTARAEEGEGERDTLTGDWGGWRSELKEAGIAISGTYTGEVLGNPSGGIRRGAVYEGLAEIDVDADFDKLMGWQGATAHLSTFQINGRGLSSNYLRNQFTVRDIEAVRAVRIWSLWLQQSFADDMVSVRVGQMPEQEEFGISSLGAYFINGTFGWPIGFAANMPSGGGAYPLSMMGARLKVAPTDKFSAMVAVFNGDPAPGVSPTDPQERNRTGTRFDIKQSPAIFTEIAYGTNPDKSTTGLPGMVKLGNWIHTGWFTDLRYDANGESLATSAAGAGGRSRGNWGVYGIVDQMVFREEEGSDKGMGVFARLTLSPPEVNAMPVYGEIGATYKGLLPGRDADVLGLAFAYGMTSPALSDLDRDNRAAGNVTTIRDYEGAVELIYRYEMTPYWTIIPDAQYIVHPGAHAAMPDDPSKPIPDAFVIGLRTVLKL